MQNNLAKPLGDRVLVKPEQLGDKTTKSGIILFNEHELLMVIKTKVD